MKTGKRILFSLYAIILGIVTAVGAGCMFDIIKVQGSAMETSIEDGDRVLISRLSYFTGIPDTGDVVAFQCDVHSEDEEGSILVRRVAAVEGDNVEIQDGILYINGERYEEYASRGVYLEPMDEITVGRNRVFVLSDSGQCVLDSRDKAVGQLRYDELMGRVLFK